MLKFFYDKLKFLYAEKNFLTFFLFFHTNWTINFYFLYLLQLSYA